MKFPALPHTALGVLMGLSVVPALAQNTTTGTGDRVQEEVVVYGKGSQVTLSDPFAGGQVARGGRAGMLGNLDMMDAPFSSLNFTETVIRQQQSRSVADVLQNDPVVRVGKGFGNFQEVYEIRGFPIFSDDMTYNGLYGILPRQFVAAELLERVEVFRGANSFINGASPGGSSVGGAVNLVPKRAAEEPLTRLSSGVETGGQLFVGVDIGRRFGTDDQTGVRFNALRRDGEMAVDDQQRELDVFSVGLDHQGERLRLSADLGYQDHRINAPRPSVTPFGAIPDVPEADSNFAQPWTYTQERQWFGVVRAEYDLTDTTSVWVAAGMRDGEEDNVLANPNSDTAGITSSYRFDNVREDEVFSGDVGLTTSFNTGPVGHQLTLSASRYSLESSNAYAFSNFAGFAGDLYQPYEVSAPVADFFVGGDLADPGVTEETETISYAIADMLSLFDERVILTLGVRHQTIEQRSFDYSSGVKLSEYDESEVTPIAALVYKPLEAISLYANYSEALLPGETAPQTSGGQPVQNAGEIFEPYRSRQYELGAKFDYQSLAGNVSVFQLAKPQGRVENQVFDDSGEQRHRGLEVSLFGQPFETLRLVGGATWLKAETSKTQGGEFDGNEAIGVPELQMNMNAEWDLTSSLTLDARALYTGSQYADAANDIKVDAWYRVDLGVRYRLAVAGKPLTLSARINNLTDENDWVSVGGYPGSNYLVLGAPRTVLVSAAIDL